MKNKKADDAKSRVLTDATAPARTVYFGGELFSLKHILGNAYLAEEIYERSHGRFLCRLPQDIEFRNKRPKTIRDKDLLALIESDLALFNFDGTELDGGTLVEFMFAKFADIPAVILRSDIRASGDQPGGAPWNLMASFWPRTVSVVIPSLALYKTAQKQRSHRTAVRPPPASSATDDIVVRLAGLHSSATAQRMCEVIADKIVTALDKATRLSPTMPKHLREEVYQWLARMPGLDGKEKVLRKHFESILAQKVRRDLL
ncbi:nucleoside 2-deoxyribosyltransferase [Geminisphaera colitermitum]|uniref:nucleoside 2-deoxyribosyltransferase n=1 Tax=Geminisphaera colitermitum TaxID=1148786 RepID=UPI0001965229|nr:nucleoside 2-deoxyribosyltransferase [Geminisphaera colitermitum]